MKHLVLLTLIALPALSGCSLLRGDPVPPSPALVGVNAQDAAFEGDVRRTPDGFEFVPLEDARSAVNAAVNQPQVQSFDTDALTQAKAALAQADTGWQAMADSEERPVDELADVADDAHRAQRLAEIARYTAVREINLKQLLALTEQIEARQARQPAPLDTTSSGISGAESGLVGQRVIPDRLGDVAFESGTARLTGPSRAVVARLAALLKSNPEYGVAVLGHTDNIGPADSSLRRFVGANPGLEKQAPTHAEQVRAFNLALSSARARSVAQTLVENGIEARRIGARGFGDTRPIASNATAEGRRANRRIEAIIVPGPDSSERKAAGGS